MIFEQEEDFINIANEENECIEECTDEEDDENDLFEDEEDEEEEDEEECDGHCCDHQHIFEECDAETIKAAQNEYQQFQIKYYNLIKQC